MSDWAGFWLRGPLDFGSAEFHDALIEVADNFERSSSERRQARQLRLT
jgi:hypothetical protein